MNYSKGKDISEWDDSYSVGISEIDDQHKKLFEYTALFHHATIEGDKREALNEVFPQLRDYASLHFKTEEQYFRDHPEHEFHQQIHKAFLLQLAKFEQDYQSWKKGLSAEILTFLRHWLVTHITETDKRFLVQNPQESSD